MDRQSVMQGSGGSGGSATQELLYAAGRGQPDQPQVVDGTFLMELLEDAPAADQPPEDVDRLNLVIRSLEAEIGGGGPPAAPAADGGSTAEDVPSDVDSGLDDVLSDLGSSPGPCAAEALPFEYWAAVPPAVGHLHDMGGWYVDGDGVMVWNEFREQCYYGYGESPAVEQLVYTPLWE